MEHVACRLRYSGAADAFFALAVGVTLALVLLVAFPAQARLLIIAWALGGAALARIKLARTRWLRLSCDGAIEVHAGGRVVEGRLVPGSFVAPWLTIIAWRPHGARLTRRLVLLPGAAPPVQLRAIRVILRWA